MLLIPMLRPLTRKSPDEWAAFEAALAHAGLPLCDLDEPGQHYFSLAGKGAAGVYGGYLLAGTDALLRSIVVPTETQRRGLGRRLVSALLRDLRDHGVQRVWLLTNTAGPFFERLGFSHAERRSAPAQIAATPQFKGICPDSAAFMGRRLSTSTTKPKGIAMTEKVYNVLFLCTGNSARSIMAECILNREGAGRFRAFSAGSFPKGHLHPETVELLTKLNYDLSEARSKSWDEFAKPGAPSMDFIFTVCDSAAGEVCPIWPGHPMTAHWGVPDPAAVTETGAERALRIADIYRMLNNRISIFINLRLDALDHLALQSHLHEIGRSKD